MVHIVEGALEAVVLPNASLVVEPLKKVSKPSKNGLMCLLTRYYADRIVGRAAKSEGLHWTVTRRFATVTS